MKTVQVFLTLLIFTDVSNSQDTRIIMDKEFAIAPQQSTDAFGAFIGAFASTSLVTYASPPFEISCKFFQGKVPNKQEYYPNAFQILVNDEELGTIQANTEVLGVVNQKEMAIGDGIYTFTLELTRLRAVEPPKMIYYGTVFEGDGKRLIRAVIRITVEKSQ